MCSKLNENVAYKHTGELLTEDCELYVPMLEYSFQQHPMSQAVEILFQILNDNVQ